MRERLAAIIVLGVLGPGLLYVSIVLPALAVATVEQYVPYYSRMPLTKGESVLIFLGGVFLSFVFYNIAGYFLTSPDGYR